MVIKNDRLLRALRRQPVDRTPVWIMRQAGRYLPEYRRIRAKAGSFMALCRSPALACEVTLQPIERYPLDAAILFSDILTIPDAMGLGLHFVGGEGPRFEHPLRTAQAIKRLIAANSTLDLTYVMAAIRLIQQALGRRIPLIGFAGSPWTLACYMVEGGASRHFHHIKALLYNHPALLHQLLDYLANAVTRYLNEQIDAGVDVVMLFDSWGGILSTPAYHAFSLAYLEKIVRGVSKTPKARHIPSIVFTKGGGGWLESMANIGCDALGLDWQTDLNLARRRVGERVALQGNMDPAVLLASADCVRKETQTILSSYGPHQGHIFNLGHGITPDVPPDNVMALIEAIHAFHGHSA